MFLEPKESPFKGYATQPKEFFTLLKQFNPEIYQEYLQQALLEIQKTLGKG